jgi:hypothetical protein
MFFQFVFDINTLADLGSHSPFYIMWTIFILGGWIPVTFIFLWGMKRVWLEWRQDLWLAKRKYVLLAIDVPKENEQLPKAVENIFSHIWGGKASVDWIEKWWKGKKQPTFGFEICSHGGYVQYYIRCEERLRDLVESAIFSQYPDAEINEVEDYSLKLKGLKFPNKEVDIFGTEFILKKPSYLPIRTYLEFEEKLAGEFKDPLGTLLESLSKMRPEEDLWIQIVARPIGNEWKEEGERYIKKVAGLKSEGKPGIIGSILGVPMGIISDALVHGSVVVPGEGAVKKTDDAAKFRMLMLTPDVKAQLEGVSEKISKSGYQAKIRVIYYAPLAVKNVGRVWATVKGSFALFASLGSNYLGLYKRCLTKGDYFWERMLWINGRKRKLLSRYIRRSGDGAPFSIMNIEELATLYHFPVLTVKAPLVKKTESRRAEPPVYLPVSSFTPGEIAANANASREQALPDNLPTSNAKPEKKDNSTE